MIAIWGTLLVLPVFIVSISLATDSCPQECNCTNNVTDCSHVKLEIVPKGLDVKSEIFNLSNNKIDFLDEDSFEYSPYRREILLSFNKINYINIKTFSKLENLQVLVLSDNQLRTLHYKMFESNSCLQYLDLHNNTNLTVTATDPFLNIPSLVSLILSDCNIEQLSAKTFAHMANLQYLNMNNNKLKTLDPSIFQTLRYLTQLEVKRNYLVCDCKIQEVAHWIRNRNICIVGKKCYKNNHSLPADWDALDLGCPMNTSIKQNIESSNTPSTAKCSKAPELTHFSTIRNECEQLTTSLPRAQDDNSTSLISSTTLLATTEQQQTFTLGARNFPAPTSEPVFLSSSHIIFITLGACGAFIIIVVIVCLLRHSAQEHQRQRDMELIEIVATTLLKKDTDQRQQSSPRYSPTPSLPRSVRPYYNLPLDVVTQMNLETYRPASSRASYLEPRSYPELETRPMLPSTGTRQYSDNGSRTSTRRPHHELHSRLLPKHSLQLEDNEPPSSTQLSILDSHGTTDDSDYHIYEEINLN